jgi:hypothetical protein
MYWVIQENLFHEEGMEEFIRVLERMDLPHSFHKVVPFSGELIPPVSPPNPVIAIGAYSMLNYARMRSWFPGVFTNGNFDFMIWRHNWKEHCLNVDAKIYPFALVPKQDLFFMRPTMDSKQFTGAVFEWDEYEDWRSRIVDLKEDTGTTLKPSTSVLVCSPKDILREYRLWIIDKKVVTASLYKIGDRVRYDENVEQEVIDFGRRIVQQWAPDRAFVLDVALTYEGYKVVEINCINAAGLYAANVGLLINAFENMGYDKTIYSD